MRNNVTSFFFYKVPLPDELPVDLKETINKLKQQANDKEHYLHLVYDFLTHRYRGYRFHTYIRFWDLFVHDISKIWHRQGFLHCTTMNYLLRIFLVKSGLFSEDDIKLKYSLIWYISPHQYCSVRVEKDRDIEIDIWNHAYGVGWGDHARGFH